MLVVTDSQYSVSTLIDFASTTTIYSYRLFSLCYHLGSPSNERLNIDISSLTGEPVTGRVERAGSTFLDVM